MTSPPTDTCVEHIAHLGTDLTVVNAARASLDKHHDVFDQVGDTKLIQYLARNSHWTPFGHPQIQLRITVPIFIARQWVKSSVGTNRAEALPLPPDELPDINEISRRYVDNEPEFFRFSQFRMRPDKSIKQGSGADFDTDTNGELINMMLSVELHCSQVYREMIAIGVAPEQARAMLPQSMLTQWYETGSLAYWARFCGLRLDGHAQKEIREYAQVIDHMVGELFPVSWAALLGRNDDEGNG